VEEAIVSDGVRLSAHLAEPQSLAAGGPIPALVLCHGFPAGPRGAASAGQTYPQFADRLAAELGWTVLTFNFRGTGTSQGQFSLGGWLDDVRAAVGHLLDVPRVGGVWVAGSSTGGALALCAAAEDERIRGVAALASPADFDHWASDPPGLLAHAREIAVVTDSRFPTDMASWSRELAEIRPVSVVGKIAPRPVLLIHGDDDDDVPVEDARILADAAGESCELRIVAGAGHRLRHDPRAVAVLLGWLERQSL
jgi:fermentation-respiration switch protein FrsA (DUF1100 family)